MDPTMTLILIAGLAVILVVGVGVALFGDFSGGAKQRLGFDQNNQKNAFGKRRTREQSVHEAATAKLDELQQSSTRVTLRLRLTQAGMQMSPAQFFLTFQMLGLVAAGVAYLITGELLIAAGVGFVVALAGPRWFLSMKIDRRVLKFTANFPAALDVLVRGVKSGLPVSEGLKIVSNEIPDPVKGEFRLLVDSSMVGVSLDDALARMSERVPSQDVSFFRTVLTIQKQTGGNLAESLNNLSETLRERYKLKLKVRALTSEARVSAIILGCLPLVVGGAVYLLRPDYIELLFIDDYGKQMLIGAGVWMTLGVLVLRAMVKFKF